MSELDGLSPGVPDQIETYRIDRGSARSGATGVVVSAIDAEDGRRVAIKLLNELVPAAASRARLAREARISREVDAPFVARFIAADTEASPPYLVMEYVPHTLASFVLERGRLAPSQALRLMEQLAEALQHLHASGVVHRDLSPANVGLTDDLDLRLFDFGISVVSAQELGQSTAALGTPGYAAPERLVESRYDDDPRTDLYSLGCLAYFIFEGAAPFDGDAPPSAGAPRPIPAMVRTPEWLRPIISRLLDPDPDRRFASAAAVRAALRDGSRPSARALAGSTRGGFKTWLLAPALGVLVAALIGALTLNRESSPPLVLAGPPATETPAPATPEATAEPAPVPPGPRAGARSHSVRRST